MGSKVLDILFFYTSVFKVRKRRPEGRLNYGNERIKREEWTRKKYATPVGRLQL